ncbi:hypothetical protein HID58_072390 [Brassica napus]|uniref:Uncharacterized protein n=2 Tax=Brassica TaxID=3705 RepID=A0ABQ7Z4B5_BRANA|nr:hypothetical protein Bca52824_083409 [Brassica carinata]KAH0875028.1 hypothetical protein HID58_072390 [Brassica napus]
MHKDLLLHRQPPTSLVHPVSATPPPASPTTPPLAREMEFADIPKKRSCQTTTAVPTTSCKKHVNDDNTTFLANFKDRFSAFVNTPMDEHKTCFKNTMNKVRSQFSIPPSTMDKVCSQFSVSSWMSKDDAQKKVDDVKKVESHSPL